MDDRGGLPRPEQVDLGLLPSARTSADIEDDQDYDPGWLGVVLRWPVRVAAVVVVLPVQIVWQTARAAGRGVVRAAGRFVGRPLKAAFRRVLRAGRAVAAGIGAAARVVGRGALAVLRPVGRVVGVCLLALADGLTWVGRTVAAGVLAIGRPLARVLRVVFRKLGRGFVAVGRALAVVGRALFLPVRLVGRGAWYVLRLLGHWLLGLLHVIGEGLEVAWRVGGRVGRGVVWVWTRAVWNPLRLTAAGVWSGAKWLGRGVRAVWLPVWRPLRAAWKATVMPAARGVRAVGRAVGGALRRTRVWYRHEISEPIRSALRTARRDVRRALGGGRRD